MSLSDLIYQVPRLLELMPSECLAALIATSTAHRRQVHDCVTSIILSNSTHASHLISCRWPRLVKWTIADQDSYMLQNIYVTCDCCFSACQGQHAEKMAVRAGLPSAQCCCCSGDCQGGLAFPRGTLLLACQADKGSSAGVGGSQLASIELYVIC